MHPSPLPTDPTLSRRSAIAAGLSACGACLLAGCGGATGGGGPAIATLAAGPVDVGPAAATFPRDGIYDAWAARGFFVVRRGDRLFAPSSICTHQQVLLHASSADIGCPRHGSVFTPEGVVTKSPAKRPLPRLAVRLDDRGHLVVDPSTRFTQDRWDATGAFVRV